MAKYKNNSAQVQRFNIGDKEHIVEPNGKFTAEPNSFLDGAVALGVFEQLDEPEAQTEKPADSPKNNGK